MVLWLFAAACLAAWAAALYGGTLLGGAVHALPVVAAVALWKARREPPASTPYSRWLKSARTRR